MEREPAAWHDHMYVRMMCEGRAPGVQDRGDADPRAEVLGIGCDGEQGLGRVVQNREAPGVGSVREGPHLRQYAPLGPGRRAVHGTSRIVNGAAW